MRTERTLGHQFDGASELLREHLLRLKPPEAERRSILGRAKRDEDISELTPDRRVSRRVAHGCQTPPHIQKSIFSMHVVRDNRSSSTPLTTDGGPPHHAVPQRSAVRRPPSLRQQYVGHNLGYSCFTKRPGTGKGFVRRNALVSKRRQRDRITVARSGPPLRRSGGRRRIHRRWRRCWRPPRRQPCGGRGSRRR